ncbi:MAG TPA: c-type cytochrome, partial [Chryseolinea sp.]|nr:c-type cytochrome [Chryseolinea sp.]
RIDYDPHRVISDKGGNVVRLPKKTVTDSASLKIDGHKQSGGEITIIDSGRLLIESLDCKVCHKVNEVSNGPSFSAVEKKYARKTKSMTNHLSQKIINGGTGVWGQASMPAHPTLSKANALLIIEYIYSLSPKSK